MFLSVVYSHAARTMSLLAHCQRRRSTKSSSSWIVGGGSNAVAVMSYAHNALLSGRATQRAEPRPAYRGRLPAATCQRPATAPLSSSGSSGSNQRGVRTAPGKRRHTRAPKFLTEHVGYKYILEFLNNLGTRHRLTHHAALVQLTNNNRD